LPEPADPTETLTALLASPTIASKEWAFRQYDQQVGINTLVLPGSDATVLRVKGTRRALAVSTDGNGRHVFLDPRIGTAMAVCEAARNVSCAGARPLGVTDCMNFGSPERPEILWQFAEAIEGMASACRALDLPVVGGNVSFYNETMSAAGPSSAGAQAILPTPIIGVVGLLEDAGRLATQWFKAPGHRIALLGGDAVSLGGSEYLWTLHRRLAGTLAPLDLELERRVQTAVQAVVGSGLATAVHDCSDGGLAVTLAEACISGRDVMGCSVSLPAAGRTDVTLFGEGPSRVVVAVEPSRAREFEALMAESAIPWRWIGTTGGERLRIAVGTAMVIDAALETLEQAWRTGFERHVA
jgi:phosphoribosylformylglycinamidine synthase